METADVDDPNLALAPSAGTKSFSTCARALRPVAVPQTLAEEKGGGGRKEE